MLYFYVYLKVENVKSTKGEWIESFQHLPVQHVEH